MTTRPLFIGCACDSKFAEPTATMLTSLDLNGQVPEATVIVAGFDLTESDCKILRAGAGDREVRFLDVTRDGLGKVNIQRFTTEYPPPVLGRLVIAEAIKVPGARLLTLDSDMIVNESLRPLVDRDLGPQYFAAIHDPGRIKDVTYFNSGLTLCDVDMYKHYDVGNRCLRWLADSEHHPHFPDQDALNEIVGHSWHRLARTWNFFCYNEAGCTLEDLETCKIAHFAGPKPWDIPELIAGELYRRYNDKLWRRVNSDNEPPLKLKERPASMLRKLFAKSGDA